ncbi:MAG: hypothetical protein ACP5XB_19075 [Isosphaeraceae bacterium]
MMLRCPSRVALVGALLALGLGLPPLPAHAASVNPNSSITTAAYRLTSSVNIPAADPTSQVPQVVALISPAGAVVPPTNSDGSQGSPLTILPTSSGFDTSQLVVALKNGTTPGGQAQQELGLDFFGSGLKAGGVLDFTLSVDTAVTSTPPLLSSLTPGITITAEPSSITTTNGAGGGSSSGDNSVPEPVGIVLWSTVLVGLVARQRLRRQPPAH